jgi:hypothetical protein
VSTARRGRGDGPGRPAARPRGGGIEGDGLALGGSGDSLKFRDLRGQLEWYFVHFFGFFAGYRSVHLETDSNDHGRATIDYAGPYAGMGVKL